MTKEEILQKVNDYCTEKQYTTATLTDGFKEKFANHFLKGKEEVDINDEAMLESMKFALNTAFSSASELATLKTNEFTTKENELKNQIAELNTKIGKPQQQQQQTTELPDDVKQQLKELQDFKDDKLRQEKLKNIIELAKKGVRQDLHASFDKFAADYEVDDTKEEEQAQWLTNRFQEIFKDSIGSIKPLAPQVQQQNEEEYFKSLKKVKVQ